MALAGRQAGDGATDRALRRDHWSVVLDSPDPRRLAHFYSELFGWPTSGDDDPTWVTLRPPEGVSHLGFQLSEDYVAPTWPNEAERQQMMMHLDIEVDDLDVATESAVALGARISTHQPQADVRVLLDPDGHPFCLWSSA
jgi:predicted enzyme related to lactoylglutathione lyase